MKAVFIGGHITPALATMDALKRIQPNVELFFVGRKHTREGDKSISAELEIIKEKGIPFFAITTGRLQRQFTEYTIPSLLKIPVGFYQAFNYLKRTNPDIVVSFGGYVAVPVVAAAKILGIKIITHEQTLVPGLANKIISRFADLIALSFEDTKKYYPHAHLVVTGNPLRKEIFEKKGNLKFDFNKDFPIIYVTGGNQGAHQINQVIFDNLEQILSFSNVIHQTGNSKFFNDYQKAIECQKLNDSSTCKYIAFDYVRENVIGDVLNLSDLVITRAGANTLCELLALGKKAIMIPISKTSHDEQTTNARFYASTGLGIMVEEQHLTGENLLEQIKLLIESVPSQSTIDAARNHISLNAADRLAEAVVKYSK